MQEYSLSEKIKVASFLCTIMVVLRHSLNHIAFWNEWRSDLLAGTIEGGFSILTQIAVPYFFLVSGFFFLKKSYYDNSYLVMFKKKWKTLIVPYILWNIIGLAEQVLAREYQFISIDLFLYDFLLSEWNGPLWYVRTLILFMFLYPLYGWIFKINSYLLHFVVLVFLLYLWMPVDCRVLSTEGLLFFYIGGCLQKYSFLLDKTFDKLKVLLACLFWVIVCFIQPMWCKLTSHVITLFGIVVFWNLVDFMPSRFVNKILKVAGLSFFIYANHVYPLKAIKITFAKLFPGNEIVALFVYFFAPIVVVIVFTYIGLLLQKKAPKIMAFVTGGRS